MIPQANGVVNMVNNEKTLFMRFFLCVFEDRVLINEAVSDIIMIVEQKFIQL